MRYEGEAVLAPFVDDDGVCTEGGLAADDGEGAPTVGVAGAVDDGEGEPTVGAVGEADDGDGDWTVGVRERAGEGDGDGAVPFFFEVEAAPTVIVSFMPAEQ